MLVQQRVHRATGGRIRLPFRCELETCRIATLYHVLNRRHRNPHDPTRSQHAAALTQIGRRWAGGGGKDGGSAARSGALSATTRGIARRRRDGERGRDGHRESPRRRATAEREVLGIARCDEPLPLLRQRGRREEAVALLAPILGWFEEGFDTADLKEAKALLDEATEPAIAARDESGANCRFQPIRPPACEVVKVTFGSNLPAPGQGHESLESAHPSRSRSLRRRSAN
jgi:hypothetical protein